MFILSRNAALRGLLDQHLAALSQEEGLAPETITSAIEAGSMVLLGNPAHAGLAPIVRPAFPHQGQRQYRHLAAVQLSAHRKTQAGQALEAGADITADLSIAGDLDAIRTGMLAACLFGVVLVVRGLALGPGDPASSRARSASTSWSGTPDLSGLGGLQRLARGGRADSSPSPSGWARSTATRPT